MAAISDEDRISVNSFGVNNVSEDRNLISEDRRYECSYFCIFATVLSMAIFISNGMAIGYNSTHFNEHNSTSGSLYFTDNNESYFKSIIIFGSIIGILFASKLISFVSTPKYSVIICYVISSIAWIGLYFGEYNSLYALISRFTTGVSIGMSMICSPTYAINISTVKWRNSIRNMNLIFTTFGIFFVSFISIFLPSKIVIISASVISIFGLIIIIFMPETPMNICKRITDDSSIPSDARPVIRNAKVLKQLKKLRSKNSDINSELQYFIHLFDAKSRMKYGLNIRDIKHKKFYKPLILSILLSIMYQASGIYILIYRNNLIFDGISITYSSYVVGTDQIICILGLFMFISSMIGCAFVHRVNRTTLIFTSGMIVTIELILLASYYQFQSYFEMLQKTEMETIPIVISIVLISTIMSTYPHVTWMVIAEISPFAKRESIQLISVTINLLIGFLIVLFFKSVQNVVGMNVIFYSMAGVSLLPVIAVKLSLPETKGKSMEQLAKIFE